MIDSHSVFLLVSAAAAVVGLILLIAVVKLNPFLTLLIASLALAVVTGMPPSTVIHSFELGVGATLGHIAVVVALGTMLGKMMAESGGADQIAYTLIRVFGEKRLPWAMVLIGLVVGLPAFFEVGFVLLIPIAYTVARRTKTSLVLVGLPMVAGLSVVHGLVPPHPAALLAVTIFKADVGKTIFYALLVGLPTAIVAGPLYAKFIAPRIELATENSISAQFVDHDPKRSLPSFGLTLFSILLPVLLMLIGSWADAVSVPGSGLNQGLRLAGNDDMALLIGVLVSFFTLGRMIMQSAFATTLAGTSLLPSIACRTVAALRRVWSSLDLSAAHMGTAKIAIVNTSRNGTAFLISFSIFRILSVHYDVG